MWAAVLKGVKAFTMLKNKSTQNLGKKIMIALLSPVIAFVFLVGGIFSDGINFNHNLVFDLFNGVPVSITGMESNQIAFIHEIEGMIPILNQKIDTENIGFAEGESVDAYLVKGFYIGIMFSNQQFHLTEENVDDWMQCYIEPSENGTGEKEEHNETKKHPVNDTAIIFSLMEHNMNLALNQDTKELMLKVVEGLRGGAGTSGTVTTLSKEQIEKLIENLPEDTSELRKQIVIQAADAVGKIPYYWGGAASYPGYDGNDFGKPVAPDEAGRGLKGMDCSHFVDWVYWTVMNNNLGNTNTTGQIAQCVKISPSELKPGDLAFLMEGGTSTHVGIYAGKNDKGEAVWIHENAGDNNVSMNTVSYWNLYCRLNIMKDR
ncbi:peptidoglycan endopeptidase [Absiella sp. AM54-8XD]|nr:peptidoglycan endopeptidase [Absiella sp. AM54-8XD]